MPSKKDIGKLGRVLLFDIETAPNIGYTWAKWQTDVIAIQDDWHLLSFAYKWLGDTNVEVRTLPDFAGYKNDMKNDKLLSMELWDLFNKADVVVAHNGKEFDVKKANARFIHHGLKPPKPFKVVDTKIEAKKRFRFDSNKLDELGRYLGIGRKLQTGGFELWLGCLKGDKKCWDRMAKYNKQDVVLLEKVYLKLLGWMEAHPNHNLYIGTQNKCPNCGHGKLTKEGFRFTRSAKYQQYSCKSCGAWCSGEAIKLEGKVLR